MGGRFPSLYPFQHFDPCQSRLDKPGLQSGEKKDLQIPICKPLSSELYNPRDTGPHLSSELPPILRSLSSRSYRLHAGRNTDDLLKVHPLSSFFLENSLSRDSDRVEIQTWVHLAAEPSWIKVKVHHPACPPRPTLLHSGARGPSPPSPLSERGNRHSGGQRWLPKGQWT